MKLITYRKFVLFFAAFSFASGITNAQNPVDTTKKPAVDTVKKPAAPQNTLTFGLDMRTRFEVRHGYRTIPIQDTTAAFLISQRTRFNVDFKSKNLDVFLSLQDARV